MNILLAAVGFINNNILYNKNKIIDILKKYCNKTDLIVFGEAFLQGFDSLTWDYEKDTSIALLQNSEVISEIRDNARKYNTAISFGYIEKENEEIYSSQITIDNKGNIINNYRRISTGWKEQGVSNNYKEGTSFQKFILNDLTFSVGLCGDLWYDENVKKIRDLKTDIVLWPVYVDFNYKEWNEAIKYEYATQAKNIGTNVLLVNSYCLDVEEENIARGGAIMFKDGEIVKEEKAGYEKVLLITI